MTEVFKAWSPDHTSIPPGTRKFLCPLPDLLIRHSRAEVVQQSV